MRGLTLASKPQIAHLTLILINQLHVHTDLVATHQAFPDIATPGNHRWGVFSVPDVDAFHGSWNVIALASYLHTERAHKRSLSQ